MGSLKAVAVYRRPTATADLTRSGPFRPAAENGETVTGGGRAALGPMTTITASAAEIRVCGRGRAFR